MAQEDHSAKPGTPDGSKHEEVKSGGGPLGFILPTDPNVWKECRKLVSDKNSRVENLAVCASQDPIISMELLKVSNAMYFSGGKAPITTLKTAIVRLGADVVLEQLENLGHRPPIENEDTRHWVEVHRSRCKRTAIVAKIIGEAVARTLSDDCEAAALFGSVGEMLAAGYLNETYVRLAEEHSRSGVNYRLAQDHKFDVEKMGLNYLKRQGIPDALTFAIDREARPRTPDRAIMKPICNAAAEMIDAFDNNRWEKLAPGKTLPPKSAVRMLGLSDQQYLKIYERVSEYLFATRQLDEKKKQEALKAQVPSDTEPTEADKLQSDIEDLITGDAEELEEEEEQESEAAPAPAVVQTKAPTESTKVRNELFGIKQKPTEARKIPRVEKTSNKPTQAPVMRTAGGNKVMDSVTNIIDKAASSEELLTQLMQMLVDQGPFEKSALIVVSKDRKQAIVVAARGPSIGNGQKLDLNDPLSPLAQCFSKVQSFGNRSNDASPWGSKAFALAPIDADHGTPVALYADCGTSGSITFEARRVFRNVVEILNQKLPEIPGGIPVEI